MKNISSSLKTRNINRINRLKHLLDNKSIDDTLKYINELSVHDEYILEWKKHFCIWCVEQVEYLIREQEFIKMIQVAKDRIADKATWIDLMHAHILTSPLHTEDNVNKTNTLRCLVSNDVALMATYSIAIKTGSNITKRIKEGVNIIENLDIGWKQVEADPIRAAQANKIRDLISDLQEKL